MSIIINGSNTPTAGAVAVGDGTTLGFTSAGTSGQFLQSNGSSAPSWVAAPSTSPAGSTGQLQYNNAGAFGAVSSGTTGQVLTSAGSGAAPTWASVGGSGLVWLSTVSASNSATVDVETTFDSTYAAYLIQAVDVVLESAGQELYGRLKIGGSYLTSGYSWRLDRCSSTGSSTDFQQRTSTSSGESNIFDIASFAYFTSFSMIVPNPSGTALRKMVYWQGAVYNGSGLQNATGQVVNTSSTAALTGVRFLSSSGLITSGTFRLYGIANS